MLLRDLTDEELTAALDELQTNGIIEWRPGNARDTHKGHFAPYAP